MAFTNEQLERYSRHIILKEEGHEILKLNDNQDGTFTLFVKKVGD